MMGDKKALVRLEDPIRCRARTVLDGVTVVEASAGTAKNTKDTPSKATVNVRKTLFITKLLFSGGIASTTNIGSLVIVNYFRVPVFCSAFSCLAQPSVAPIDRNGCPDHGSNPGDGQQVYG